MSNNKALKDMYKRHMKQFGEEVLIDGQQTRTFFKEYNEGIQQYDYKYIFTDLDKVKQGSAIDALGCKWLAFSQSVNFNNVYEKSLMRQVKYTIKFNFEGEIVPIYSCIDTKTQDTEFSMIKIATGDILVILQENENSNRIKIDDRFIIMGSAWKVVGFDKSKRGLTILYAENTQFNNTDDRENEIADRWQYEKKHTYTIEAEEYISLNIGDTKEIKAIVKDTVDDIATTIESPALTFKVDNESVCTVDEKGIITAIAEGETTVKVTFENVVKEIKVKVVEVVQLEIVGKNSIRWGFQAEYKANPDTAKVTWSINDKGTNTNKLAKIIETTDNRCTVKANSDMKDGIVILKATDRAGNVVTKEIIIKSIYG
ncbi:Ig-like domain-containing protein [Anaerophilus nitritogenes]|uniref:Ig-like domain-containing protein n=1 Tax=Anaerophilus nitritogenes TaxID=2498136 RepID=UPI0013EC3EA5|nr:Ig-like domain-containing protein [Anaerophilus nitritogenes]